MRKHANDSKTKLDKQENRLACATKNQPKKYRVGNYDDTRHRVFRRRGALNR